MEAVIIDREKCIGCGECAADCVSHHIVIEDGRARTLDNRCIECGHCYAICPVQAVDMPGYDLTGLEGTLDMSALGADRLLTAMESRRSARRFTAEPVSGDDLRRILEAGRYCPTGSNAQDVHFVVLRERLEEAEEEALRVFSQSQRLAGLVNSGAPGSGPDRHFFFKGAPLAIVVAGHREVDPALASSYMELMAQALGLGVLYSGYFVFAAKHSAPLKELLDLPAGVEPVTTLVIGHSDIRYSRRVPRKPLKVRWC